MRRGAIVVLAWGLCAGVSCARGGWEDPSGGWDYLYEADAGQAEYLPMAGTMVSGLLDASWLGGIETYFWDGSAPGEYDAGDAAGLAPGGAALQSVAGKGEDGGDAAVLSLEVAGDTTTATGTPFAFAWTTPANEALYFLRGTTLPGQTSTASVKDGMTLIARWRLTPNPVDVEPPVGRNWQSAGFTSDGKGMLSIVDQGDVNASLSFKDDGTLWLMDRFQVSLPAAPTEFLTTWMALVQNRTTGVYQIDVFLNGSTTPALSQSLSDPPRGDETGSDPDDYIAFGLPVKGGPAAMQLDYVGYKVGYLRPGEQVAPPRNLICTVEDSAPPETLRLTWTIPTGAVYDSIDILRDGAVVATVAGTDTSYTTTEFLAGAQVYGISAVVGGQAFVPILCDVNYCPGTNFQVAIDYDRQPPAAHLTWNAYPFPATKIEITRNGTLLTDTIAPAATEYWDATLTPNDGEVTYGVAFTLADPLPCPPRTTRSIMMQKPERAYLDPDGGWDYVYDPDAHDAATNPLDRFVADKGVAGCLDGTWFRSNATDYWDGSAPGTGIGAPGGIEIRERPGAGLGGGDVKTLSIEDAGNPTTGGFPDPSNRKLVLGRELEPPENLTGGRFAEGVTLYARFRLTPDPRDVLNPPHGEAVRDSNRGMITLYYNDGDTTVNNSRSWGMSLVADTLSLTDGGDVNGLAPGAFVSVWFNVQDTDRNGNYHLNLYLNGDTTPIRADFRSGLDNHEEQFFVDTAKAYTALSLGMHTTDGGGAFELDFIKVKYGVVTPQSGAPPPPPVGNLVCNAHTNDVTLSWVAGGAYDSIEVREGAEVRATLAGDATGTALTAQPDGAHTYAVVALAGGVASAGVTCSVTLPVIVTGEQFFRGDVNQDRQINIADAVSLLGYLFASKPAPACPDSADNNDDGRLNIADAIQLLGHLFGNKGELPPPSGKVCGADPSADELGPCDFPQCANP